MHPKPVLARQNTLPKQSPAPVYPSQMTLPGGSYIAASGAPVHPKPNMQAPPNQHNPNAAQRPYLASEMAMMQDSLKIAALKTAETIRYMSTVRRVHGSSQPKRPPPAVTNELRLQLARYDQICDIVEARLVRAHAALSARLARERPLNQQSAQASLPIQIDSPMSDDVPLSLTNTAPTAQSNPRYIPPPKSRGLSSLAAQRPLHAIPDPNRIISPVTLASGSSALPTLDSIPSHHAVVPGLLHALRRQQEEQARNALHQPQAQEVAPLDIFGVTASSMDDLFLDGTNPTDVGLDIDSAVAAIDTSVGGIADIDQAVSAIHSAVPGIDSAVAELDSAVAEMAAAAAAAGDLGSNDGLFGELHARGENGTFPGENDPFVPAADGFQSVSGTGEDRAKDGLLANLDGGSSHGMDLEMDMDLIEMGDLGMGASEMGDGNVGGEGELGDMDLGDMTADGLGIGDIDEMNMGGEEIEAMWSNMDMHFFTGMGDDVHIKTEPE